MNIDMDILYIYVATQILLHFIAVNLDACWQHAMRQLERVAIINKYNCSFILSYGLFLPYDW